MNTIRLFISKLSKIRNIGADEKVLLKDIQESLI